VIAAGLTAAVAWATGIWIGNHVTSKYPGETASQKQQADETNQAEQAAAESEKATQAAAETGLSVTGSEGNVYGDSLSIGYAPNVLADAQVGEYVTFGTYEQDNDADNGRELIEWQVLEKSDGEALLLSRYVLEKQPYNEVMTEITWEECSLRKWLNGDFYSEAFSDAEKAFIEKTQLKNNQIDLSIWKERGWSIDGYDVGGNDTWDYVFLLSFDDIRSVCSNWDYNSRSDEVRAYPTDYAIERGIRTNLKGTTFWWLRSPGPTQHQASIVSSWGLLDSDYVSQDNYGVRPAIKVIF